MVRRVLRWLVAIVALIVVYFAVGSWWFYRIGDDPAFAAPAPPEGGSRAVAMAAALIERETITHHWQPPDPVFMPNGLLIHPAAFQRGLHAALARFTIELEDQIGRARGSSVVDPELSRARGLINFPPDIWFFDFSKSLLPTITSARNYRAGREALLTYNQRVAQRASIFDRRTDSLAAALARIALDLGGQSARVEQHLRQATLWPIDFDADRLFYQVKGRLYGYQMLLGELGQDFEGQLRNTNAAVPWAQLMETLREVGDMRPFFVIDGPPRGTLFASHLAIQGFYLKRAVLQLKELDEVLRN